MTNGEGPWRRRGSLADLGRGSQLMSIGRHPRDVAIALAAYVATGLCLVAAMRGVDPIESGITVQLHRLPEAAGLWSAAAWLGSITAVSAAIIVLGTLHRFRLALTAAVGGAVSYLLSRVLTEVTGTRTMTADGLHEVTTFPALHVALAAGVAGAADPYLGRFGRTVAWLAVTLVAVAEVYRGTHLPLDVVGGVFLGVASTALARVLIGAPGRKTSADLVTQALASAGFEVASIVPVRTHFGGPLRFDVRTEDRRPLEIKVVARRHRRFGAWYRLRRLLGSLDPDVEPRLSSTRHEADHEASVTLMAERAGVRTPGVVFVAALEHGPAIVVRQRVDGVPLTHLSDLDTETVDDIWRQVELLGEAGIAHHDLRDATLQVDADGLIWILDFTFAEAGASATRRAQDVAEVLVCLTRLVGVEAAVDSALRCLDKDTLRDAAPYLHPLALPVRVRSQLDAERPTLAELRETVARRTGEDLPAAGWPVRPSTVISLALLGLAVYLLLPQLATADLVVTELRHAHLGWVAATLVAGLLTFPLGAIAMAGSSPTPLGFWRTTAMLVAATFASRITPGGVGFVAVSYSYLVRTGMDRSRAAGVVALNRAAGMVVAGVGVGVGVAILGGSRAFGPLGMPPLWMLLGGGAALMALAGTVVWLPPVRRLVRTSMRVFTELAVALRRPRRALELVGGSTGFLVVSGLGLAAALAAFTPDVPVAAVVAVYLVGGTLGGAAPTPGGLGAVEAALTAGLAATGIVSSTAVAAVLTFRLATFWLPVAIGPATLRALQQRALI
ncbi:MAG: flippase-like domain-containing protein [Streptosporangiales bacterium]|nr:flippase-like domain-containing protein [Streptosporangiales bacterium]